MPLTHRGVAVTITCGGEDLSVYKETQDNETTVSGYIPSVAGQAFEVRLNNTNIDQSFTGWITLDGYKVREPVLTANSRPPPYVGQLTGLDTLCPFTFSEVQFTDEEDDSLMRHSQDLSQLGVIEVSFCRATVTKSVSPSGTSSLFPKLESSAVPEKSKKAGWHRAALGKEEKTQGVALWNCQYLDPIDAPYIVFRFRYQPAPLLRANGIMPMLPAPTPVPVPVETRHAPEDPSSSAQAGTNHKRNQSDGHQQASSSRKRQKSSTPAGSGTPSSSGAAQPKLEPENEPSTSVKKENSESGSDSEKEDEIEEIRDSLKALQSRLDGMIANMGKKKSKKNKVKSERAPSPIVVGAGNGDVIDLTMD